MDTKAKHTLGPRDPMLFDSMFWEEIVALARKVKGGSDANRG